MPARLLRSSIALLTLLVELRYTLSRLLAHPLTTGHAPRFQGLREQWSTVHGLEISLTEQVSDARAQVDIADAGLDDFAIRFSHAVKAVTGQRGDDPLYKHFFPRPLHEVRRPVLGVQLERMQEWLLSLETTPHASLAAMRPELQALVQAATQAVTHRDTVAHRFREFRKIGERQQLFDQVNAERKELHGVLTKLALSTPGLPATFANDFFKPGSDPDDAPEDTIESVTAQILALEENLAERKERLTELEQEAAQAEQSAEDRASKQARLAELKQEIAARQRELDALAGDLK